MVTLDAGAGYQYLWSDNSTGQTLDVNAAGIYSVLITERKWMRIYDAIMVSTISCNRQHSVLRPNRSIGVYPNQAPVW